MAHRPVLIFTLLVCSEISTKVTSVIYFFIIIRVILCLFNLFTNLGFYFVCLLFFFLFIFIIVYKSLGEQWFGNNFIKLVLHHR